MKRSMRLIASQVMKIENIINKELRYEKRKERRCKGGDTDGR